MQAHQDLFKGGAAGLPEDLEKRLDSIIGKGGGQAGRGGGQAAGAAGGHRQGVQGQADKGAQRATSHEAQGGDFPPSGKPRLPQA